LADHRDDWILRKQLIRDCPALASRLMATFAVREQTLTDTISTALGAGLAGRGSEGSAMALAVEPADTQKEKDDLLPSLLAALAGTALRVAFQNWDGRDKQRLETSINHVFDLLEKGL
jgi:hypothetical protein